MRSSARWIAFWQLAVLLTAAAELRLRLEPERVAARLFGAAPASASLADDVPPPTPPTPPDVSLAGVGDEPPKPPAGRAALPALTPDPNQHRCAAAIAEVTAHVPIPPGVTFECLPGGLPVDGLYAPDIDHVQLMPDASDSDATIRATAAHEIAHAWQDTLGIEFRESLADAWACVWGFCLAPRATRAEMDALASQGYPLP